MASSAPVSPPNRRRTKSPLPRFSTRWITGKTFSFFQTLPLGRLHDGGRLVHVSDARALRPRLLQSLQVQPQAHRGLSEPVGVFEGPLSAARRRWYGKPGPHQEALLRESREHKSEPHGAQGSDPRLQRTTRPRVPRRLGVTGKRYTRSPWVEPRI